MSRLRQMIADATAALGRLSARERMLVGLTAAVIVGFVIFAASLTFSRAVGRRESSIKTKLTQLEEAHTLTSTYRQAESKRAELERRLKDNKTRLFSYLDDLAKKQGLEIGGLNDKGTQPREGKITESSVEVTFTHIPLDKLVKFLEAVEGTSGLVKVTRLQIRPRTDQPVIDAWLTVTTYQLES